MNRASDASVVREATVSDAVAMAAVEAAARRIFAAHGIDLDSLPASADLSESATGTLGFVAEVDGEIVGTVRLTDLDGSVLALDQVSVRPGHARGGVGRRLLEAAVQRARELGYRAITGTTFRDVPFNAPLYARLSAVEDDDPHPAMLQRRVVERSLGLDRLGPRLIMRLRL